jgi:type IV pilus assembly protein PilO
MALSKDQQQKIVLAVMIAGGFGYVYWNYLLKPTNEKIAKLESEVANVLGQVETMKRTAARLPALQREYDSLLAEVGQTEKRLPKEKNMEEVLRVVTQQSLKNQITVRSFSPGTEMPRDYFVEIPISLTVAGSFHTLGKFMSILGQQERILGARGLSLNYEPNPQKGQTVSGNFTLLAYMFKG